MKTSHKGFVAPLLIALIALLLLGGGAGYLVLLQKTSVPSTTITDELPIVQENIDVQPTNSSTLPNTRNQLDEIIAVFKEELSKCQGRYGQASFCDINNGYIKVAQNCVQFKGKENEDKLRVCAIGFLVPSKVSIAESDRRSTIAVTNNETGGYNIICWDGAEMGSMKSYTSTLYKEDFPSGGENGECLSDLQKETIYSCKGISTSKFSACVNGIKKYGEYVPGAGVTVAIQRLDAYMAQ